MTLTSYSYKEQTTTALDANDTNSVTPSLDIKNNTEVAWSVLEKTGTHTTHVLTLQRSTDNTTYPLDASLSAISLILSFNPHHS